MEILLLTFKEFLCRLNEIISVRDLAQCLAHDRNPMHRCFPLLVSNWEKRGAVSPGDSSRSSRLWLYFTVYQLFWLLSFPIPCIVCLPRDPGSARLVGSLSYHIFPRASSRPRLLPHVFCFNILWTIFCIWEIFSKLKNFFNYRWSISFKKIVLTYITLNFLFPILIDS